MSGWSSDEQRCAGGEAAECLAGVGNGVRRRSARPRRVRPVVQRAARPGRPLRVAPGAVLDLATDRGRLHRRGHGCSVRAEAARASRDVVPVDGLGRVRCGVRRGQRLARGEQRPGDRAGVDRDGGIERPCCGAADRIASARRDDRREGARAASGNVGANQAGSTIDRARRCRGRRGRRAGVGTAASAGDRCGRAG